MMFCIDRPLPAAGIFTALHTDGEPIVLLAAAFDVPTFTIRRLSVDFVKQLLRRVSASDDVISAACNVRRIKGAVHCIEHRLGCSWCNILTTRELVETLEVRAYLRAFRNSPPVRGDYKEPKNGTL